MRALVSIAWILYAKVATEVWNFPMNQSIYCPFCWKRL